MKSREQLEVECELFRHAAACIIKVDDAHYDHGSRSVNGPDMFVSGRFLLRETIESAYLRSRPDMYTSDERSAGLDLGADVTARELNFEAEFRRGPTFKRRDPEQNIVLRQPQAMQQQGGTPLRMSRSRGSPPRIGVRGQTSHIRGPREKWSTEDYELEIAHLRSQVTRLHDQQEDMQVEHNEKVGKLRRRLKRSVKKTLKLEDEIDRLHSRLEDAEELWSEGLDD